MSTFPEFTLANLVAHFHGIKHVTYNLKTLNSNITSGAGFDPTSSDYLSSLYFFGGVGAVALVLSLLALFISCCCCCCCCKRRRTTEYSVNGGGRPSGNSAYLRIMTMVAAFLLLGFVGGAVYDVSQTRTYFRNLAGDADAGIGLINTAMADLNAAAAVGQTTLADVQSLKTMTAGDPTAPALELTQLENGLAQFNDQAGSVVAGLPSLESEQNTVDDARKQADWFYFTPMFGVAGLAGLLAFFVLFGTCCRSKCLLGFGIFLGVFALLGMWAATIALFPGSLAGSDACFQPTQYLAEKITNDNVVFYLECTSADENAFATDFDDIDASVASATAAMAKVTEYCTSTNRTDVQPLCASAAAGLETVAASATKLRAELNCQPLQQFYVDSLSSACNGVVVWVIVGLIVFGPAAVLVSLLLVCSCCLSPHISRNSDNDGDDAYAYTRSPEKEPLLARSPSRNIQGSDPYASPARRPYSASSTDNTYAAPSPVVYEEITTVGGKAGSRCEKCGERAATGTLIPCGHAQCRQCIDRALANGRCRSCWVRVNGVKPVA